MHKFELTKQDTQMAKGMAVLSMVMLHLFCRLGDLPYTPWIWIGDTPLIYYLGLFGDLCVSVFCFCSGYAHYLMADAQGDAYRKRLPGKALRFLCNYWIVVTVFALLGLFFDRSGTIPGSLRECLGNILVVGMSYNGAWWFVSTYLLLLFLSPALAALTRRVNGLLLLAVSTMVYFVAYVLRFKYIITFQEPVVQWFWNQTVLFGTSQFVYCLGMVCRKYGVVGKLRSYLSPESISAENFPSRRRLLYLLLTVFLPLAAFIGHGVVQSAFVAPFTAAVVLTSLFLGKLPRWVRWALLRLGEHSTNIWLVHMFFYGDPFRDLVFVGRYPVFVLALMLALCFAASVLIDRLYRPVLRLLDRHALPAVH